MLGNRIALDVELAEKTFAGQGYRLVIVKEQRILYTANEPRLLPLAKGLTTLGYQAKGAVVKDKVIGRAAAMLLASFNVAVVITPLMSEGAKELLLDAGVQVKADEIIPRILNTAGDDSCPMEAMVEEFRTVQAGADHLLKFFHSIDLLPRYDMENYCVME